MSVCSFRSLPEDVEAAANPVTALLSSLQQPSKGSCHKSAALNADRKPGTQLPVLAYPLQEGVEGSGSVLLAVKGVGLGPAESEGVLHIIGEGCTPPLLLETKYFWLS